MGVESSGNNDCWCISLATKLIKTTNAKIAAPIYPRLQAVLHSSREYKEDMELTETFAIPALTIYIRHFTIRGCAACVLRLSRYNKPKIQ